MRRRQQELYQYCDSDNGVGTRAANNPRATGTRVHTVGAGGGKYGVDPLEDIRR